MTHCSPPAGAAIQDEDTLLAKLETDEVSGLIITGRAGVGKTRLMLELGHRALARGWPVMKVLRGHIDRDALRQFAEQLPPRTPALLLFDYIETRGDFDDLAEEILTLNQTYCFRLRYLVGRRWRVEFGPRITVIPLPRTHNRSGRAI